MIRIFQFVQNIFGNSFSKLRVSCVNLTGKSKKLNREGEDVEKQKYMMRPCASYHREWREEEVLSEITHTRIGGGGRREIRAF